MQRGIYAIAVSEQAVEGGLVTRGETQSAFSQSLLGPAEARPSAAAAAGAEAPAEAPGTALLERFLAQASWEQGLAVLVLPTAEISYRRLHFQFGDPRKIRQVLPLELQDELLDPVDRHAFDAEIVPRPDGSADAQVYLTDDARLQALATTLERHQLPVQRVTFSAQALLQALPPPAGPHFCVYLGSEESFVVHTLDGRPTAFRSIVPHPGELLAELRALGPGSPYEQLQTLFRADADDPQRQGLRERLQERLEAARAEVNRFLRIYGEGDPFTVSLHGLFGALFERAPDAASLTLRFPNGAWPGARRTHFGVLEELLRQPRNFPGARGINFRKRVGTSLVLLRELRWPLTAAGVLLLVLAGMALGGYFLRASALQARLDAVGRELQKTLSVNAPVNSITVNSALARVQERLDRLRKERETVAYLDRYHYDTLRLVNELSEVVRAQPGVTVDSLSLNQERFTLSGTTPSYAESESLKTRVGAMERFKERTVKVTNSNAGAVIRFRLTAER
jgi:type II secretory pathway component PulL